MKRKLLIMAVAALMTTFSTVAQEPQSKLLTNEDVVLNRALSPKNFAVQWIGATDSYATTVDNAIVATDARTGKSRTLISKQEIDELLGDTFTHMPRYTFDKAGNLVVSTMGKIYTIDLESRSILSQHAFPTVKDKQIANVTHQPNNGPLFAYTIENNLYLVDGENHTAVTAFEDKNIVSGQSVSRNEFGITHGIFFSPDATQLAFFQKDESRVSDFPMLDITTRTGTLKNIKYPMNGMASEHVKLGVYNISTGETIYLNVTEFDDERYLTCITWSPDSKRIYIQVLDRAQENVALNSYDASTGEKIATILTEHNDLFVEPQHDLIWLQSDPSRFIYSTNNRDGYYNLYLCDDAGNVERLTMEKPEGGEMPEGMEVPEGGEMPEGMEMPEGGQMSEGRGNRQGTGGQAEASTTFTIAGVQNTFSQITEVQ